MVKYDLNFQGLIEAAGGCHSGVQVGVGWVEALYPLVSAICEERNKKNRGGRPRLIYMKEKFGELRVSIENPTSVLIDERKAAVERCRRICDVCGKNGYVRKVVGRMRVVCRCDVHLEYNT